MTLRVESDLGLRGELEISEKKTSMHLTIRRFLCCVYSSGAALELDDGRGTGMVLRPAKSPWVVYR